MSSKKLSIKKFNRFNQNSISYHRKRNPTKFLRLLVKNLTASDKGDSEQHTGKESGTQNPEQNDAFQAW